MILQGKRIYPVDHPFNTDPGDYWYRGSTWYGTSPNGLLCSLEKHQVTEHEDGTITVSPSILVSTSEKTWHGFLEKGIWKTLP